MIKLKTIVNFFIQYKWTFIFLLSISYIIIYFKDCSYTKEIAYKMYTKNIIDTTENYFYGDSVFPFVPFCAVIYYHLENDIRSNRRFFNSNELNSFSIDYWYKLDSLSVYNLINFIMDSSNFLEGEYGTSYSQGGFVFWNKNKDIVASVESVFSFTQLWIEPYIKNTKSGAVKTEMPHSESYKKLRPLILFLRKKAPDTF